MTKKHALQIIAVISLGGVLFSGIISFYGFFMYLLVLVISLLGLRSKK